jgi:cytochrome c2
MSFAGLRHADDRRDVIAYIAVETSAVSAAD